MRACFVMGMAMVLVIAGCRSAVEDFYAPLARARADAGCTDGSGGAGGNAGGQDAGGRSGGGCSE